jgi:hypothetical protein
MYWGVKVKEKQWNACSALNRLLAVTALQTVLQLRSCIHAQVDCLGACWYYV